MRASRSWHQRCYAPRNAMSLAEKPRGCQAGLSKMVLVLTAACAVILSAPCRFDRLAYRADEPGPVPNFRTIGGVSLIQHQRRELARFVVRG